MKSSIRNLVHVFRQEFFLLVDLQDFFFSDLGSGVGGEVRGDKKSSENDKLTGHFQSFFFKYLQNKQ